MTKKRAIVSYENLSIEQKKGILKDFPDGYMDHLSQIKTPTGDILNALIWETEETIYLVKFPKMKVISADDDDDDFDDDIDSDVKGLEDDEEDEVEVDEEKEESED